ncbi:MAG: DNA methyltransferase [Thermoplasmatales archaeon]
MILAKVINADSRTMIEIEDSAVDLVVTSPPYWHLKNYDVEGQIGFGQSLHAYLKSLYRVWKECYRVLKPGTRLCINIGDQFLRSIVYGRYKIAPLHSEFITQCERIGFDYMGSIIWQKKTTMNTTGGASVMGSYPYPPNGLVEFDYEFIMIFKKQGFRPVSGDMKEKSKLTKEEWKEYFSGHWYFNGERQVGHEAMFPEELPRRIIKMFSFVGDTILDPFLGSGTTAKVALELGRNAIGYEINQNFLPMIKEKINRGGNLLNYEHKVEFVKRTIGVETAEEIGYEPNIKDASPVISPDKLKFGAEKLYKVNNVVDIDTIELDTGLRVSFLGVKAKPNESGKVITYLNEYVKGKQVFLEFDSLSKPESETVPAYVFLKNKIFINKELVRQGLANIQEGNFKYKSNLIKVASD